MKIVTREMLEAVANTGPTSSRGQAQGQHVRAGLVGDRIPTGRRNITLTSRAGTMRRRGFGEEAIFAALWAENEKKCDPPLGEDEVRRIARSIAGYAPGSENYGGPTVGEDSNKPNVAIVELPSAPSFPLTALPPTLRRIVEEAAATIVCPPEFIAVPMLATLGAAMGNSRVLALKGGWTEGSALLAAVVADPGAKKTPASKVATRPAWRRQAEHKREYDEAMVEYRRAGEGEYEGEPPDEPTLRRTVVDDATVEALVVRLEDNPRGLLCAKDELSAWVRALDQYKGGKGADRQFYLSAWSGSPVMVDRKARKEPLMIPRPFLGLTGSIQPGVLSELKNYREDGLLDRFLFAYPDPAPSRWTDDEISGETLARYHELYERLYDLGMATDENGEPAPVRLQFTAGAKTLFIGEADTLREEMERPGFPDHLKGPWSKLEAYLARLSLILALVRIAEDDPFMLSLGEVTEPDVRAAAELLRYFKAHARRVYAKLHGEKPEYLLAEALARFLEEEGGTWEGQPSKLYGILKARSAPGLPAGEGAFGKRLRKTAEQSSGFVLTDLWRGNVQVVRLTLFTPGTPPVKGSSTGGTGGKFELFVLE